MHIWQSIQFEAFHQLTGESFVAASMKYVEGNGDMKKVFNSHIIEVFPQRVLWPSTFIHGYGLRNEYNITVTAQRF